MKNRDSDLKMFSFEEIKDEFDKEYIAQLEEKKFRTD